MKYKIIGALTGFLFLPTVYLFAVVAKKLDISVVMILAVLSFTLAGYLAGKFYADTE